MDNAQRFLNAFAGIEKALKAINRNSNATFKNLVLEASKKNVLIKKHKENLLEYAELRNALVHQRGKNNEIIAQPAESVVEDIEFIFNKLNEQPSAMMFASSPVHYANSEDTIYQVCEQMVNLNAFKFPVYENGQFLGVITSKMVATYGILEKKPNMKIKEVLAKDKLASAEFIAKDEPLVNIVDLMNQDLQRIEALIVTEHGKPHQKPLGIITLSDMPKVLEYLAK
ncbi:MAG: CBS domain-containing protein [Erysipelotrichaceae bacterium]|nr:CBS domain-containing protein [Erysipelotrichaceae bacterium]